MQNIKKKEDSLGGKMGLTDEDNYFLGTPDCLSYPPEMINILELLYQTSDGTRDLAVPARLLARPSALKLPGLIACLAARTRRYLASKSRRSQELGPPSSEQG